MTATPPAATKHKVFSLSRVWAIASNTLLELVRLKVFYFLLIFALVVIGVLFLYRDIFQDEFQSLKDGSLGAMSIFIMLLSILPTAMLLPKDLEDRTLYTILAKPVPRFEYLLGKFLGVLLLLFIAVSMMSLVFLTVLYARMQLAIGEVMHANHGHMNPEVIAEIATIHHAAFSQSLLPGIIMVYIKGVVGASVTLLISTFASSMIFTIIMSFVIHIIGHIQSVARDAVIDQQGVTHLTKIFYTLLALIIPDLSAFSLVDEMVTGAAIPFDLFAKTAALGGIYVGVYFLIAYFIFMGKEL
jgi:ABC-type transport system involved in multi-copper enzyme maturation permease subunit